LIKALRDRAKRYILSSLDLETSRIENLINRPVLRDPMVLVTSREEIITGLRDRSVRSFSSRLTLAAEDLTHVRARVRALSPQATLDRGYSVVQLEDGSIARDAKSLKIGQKLRLRLAAGETNATVTDK
jgi:exodeoxyribonuclease VII large subunit